MRDFRVHHILCTNLYQGYGYSGDFCENMTEKVNWLKANPNEKIRLVADADMICQKCPNLTEDRKCVSDENHVQIKDRALLEPLHLVEGEAYTYAELYAHAREYMTKEIFEKSCSKCEWYKQGLCSFEALDFRLENHI